MKDQLEFVRQRIEHENNLANYRLSALVGSQAFLLSAFAIGLNAPLQFRSEVYDRVHRALMYLLPIAGITTIVIMSLSMIAAMLALKELHQKSDLLSDSGQIPIHSSRTIRWLGNLAMIGVPIVFAGLWAILLVNLYVP